ncbi:MAG TPA: DMT family transporter [Xanthomonadales bacterium]|nr:DMT family transporter [Xanthomonadales bacterium]
MDWLLLTILAILFRAIYGIATKVLSSNIDASPKTQSFLLMLVATPITSVVSPFIGGISFEGISSVWLISIIMFSSLAFANVLYYKGMETLDAGTSQIAFSSILIWGTILSIIFLNSKLSPQQLFGIFILLLAIILAQYSNKSVRINKGVLYIIVSTALFAAFQVTSAEMAKTMSAGGYLLIAYLGSTLILGITYISKINEEIKIIKKNVHVALKVLLFASSTSIIYFIFSYFAYRFAPDPGIVVILLTSQALFAVILGTIFLKERDGIGRKLFAGALAVLAGILIKG